MNDQPSIHDMVAEAAAEVTTEPAEKKHPNTEPVEAPETAIPEHVAEDEDTQGSTEAAAEVKAVEPDTHPAIDLPDSWSPVLSDFWSKTPKEVQEHALKREDEIKEALSRTARERQEWQPVIDDLQPLAPALAMQGKQPAQYMRELVAIAKEMDRDPVATIQWLAQQRGVDLNSSVSQEERNIDPQYAGLQQQIVQQQKAMEAMQEQQRQAATDAGMRMAEPYFNDPGLPLMNDDDFATAVCNRLESNSAYLQMMRTGQHDNAIRRAYQDEEYANPKTRQALIDRQVDERIKAESAKRAAKATVSGSPSRVTAIPQIDTTSNGGIRDAVLASAKSLSGA